MSYCWYWHYLFLSMYVLMLSCSVVSNSLQPHGLQPIRLLCPRYFPGKSTGVGCHFFLQGIFLIQRSNPCLLVSCISCIGRQIFHCWAIGKTCVYVYLDMCVCVCVCVYIYIYIYICICIIGEEPTPVFLPAESQGWRSLVGCHLWGCRASDAT